MIVFLLPKICLVPVGGYKIVYQYAEEFAKTGIDVHLLFTKERQDFFLNDKTSLQWKIKYFLTFQYKKIFKLLKTPKWFNFKHSVKMDFTFAINKNSLCHYPLETIFFATAVETAYELNSIKSIPNNNKFYLIQDFENWNENTDEYVLNSYRFNMHKIVISKWLQEKVMTTGNNATIIPDGLDFEYFKLTEPIKNRTPYEVAMLYHVDDRKRCCDSIDALKLVKVKIPMLHVSIFGTPDKPENLPEWFSYYKLPSKETHNMIYNQAAIFVAASQKEGWGLPPAEAMQCGAALVCTDTGAVSEYAINKITALTSPVFDINKLAENIIKLINNNDLRISIATKGNEFIQKFTWKSSFALMKNEVEKYCGKI